MKLNLITLAVLLVGVVWVCLWLAPSMEWNGVRIAGAGIAGVALVLLVVARLQLGAAFSIQAKAKTLVTTGLYSRIRNPIYVFSAVFLVGIVIVLERWLLLLPIALLVPLQIVRARREARVLAAAFGEEYERYKAGTWF
jgi:protein-S-isoprenylcysteine O-methyltransferase Ste14